MNLKENVDASFNRDSSLECSAISEVPDSSTITHALRPYEHYVCSTPNVKFSNVPIINLNTSDISNDNGINPSKNCSSDLFASYVRFENSFIGSETGTANKRPVYASRLCDESTSKVIENSETAHNTISKYDLRTKSIQSFSRVTKRRKTKKSSKAAAEAMLENENIKNCNIVSLRSNRNSSSKLGNNINKICQVSVQVSSPGEARELISFKKPQKLTRYDSKSTRVLRDVKNCISKNSYESNLINYQFELDSELRTTSQFNEITSSALLVSSVDSITSDALKSADDLCITNKFPSSGQPNITQNVDGSKKTNSDSTEEESIFFRRLRNNPLRLRSNYENSTNLSNDISSQVDNLPISNTTQSSGGSSSSEINSFNNTSHGSVLEIRSESEEGLSSIANSLNSSSNISLKLQSSCDYSQNSNFTSENGGFTTQALLNVENYVINQSEVVRRSLRLNNGRKKSQRTGNISNELYGSHYTSYLSTDSGLQKNNLTSLTKGNKSEVDSHIGSTLSKEETLESNPSNNFQRFHRNTPRKQRNDDTDLWASQYSTQSTAASGANYDSNASGISFAGFQTDSITSSSNDNISSVDSLASSVLLQAVPILESCSFIQSSSTQRELVNDLSNSTVSQSFGNNSTESYRSLHASNASAISYTGLQDDHLTASITNDNISQEESLSGSTLTKAESNNSNNLEITTEMRSNDERRSTIADQSKSLNNSTSRLHNNLNFSNEASASLNISNVTKKDQTSGNSTVAGKCEENKFTSSIGTHVISDSAKSTDNINMESDLNTNFSVVPRNFTNASTSTSEAKNQFKPSKFLNNLRKKWFTPACDIPSKPVQSAAILNPDLDFPTSNTDVASNQLMSPRVKLIDNTNKLNFVNVTRRKRKQHVNGASNFYNLPAIMESSAVDLPESEQTSTNALPAVMDSIAFVLPENVHSSTCATTTENDFETHRYSVSLHSGKWRRALSLLRKNSLVRSGEFLIFLIRISF